MTNEPIRPFYVILEKNDGKCCRHSDWSSVSKEAERLARNNPTKEFIILATVEVIGPALPPIPRESLSPEDIPETLRDWEIPF